MGKMAPGTLHKVMLQHWPNLATVRGADDANKLKEKAKYKAERQDLLDKKTAICPRFHVSLESSVASSTSEPLRLSKASGMAFHVTLTYDGMPTTYEGLDDQVLVMRSLTLLQKSGLSYGLFQIFRDKEATDALPFDLAHPCFRRPRSPGGRFLSEPPFLITEERGWKEMRPGHVMGAELILKPTVDRLWDKTLEVGKTYFLRFHPIGGNPMSGAHVGPEFWRFGALEDFEDSVDCRQENMLYIPIPLEPSDTILEFIVVG